MSRIGVETFRFHKYSEIAVITRECFGKKSARVESRTQRVRCVKAINQALERISF